MQKLETELISSLATVALAIIAVAVFIYHGAGLAFYSVVAVALVVGFANAWLITRAAPEARAAPQAGKPAAFINIGAASRPKVPRRKRPKR